MASATQAGNTFTTTRQFFQAGEKSDNKTYGDGGVEILRPLRLAIAAGIDLQAASERVERRGNDRDASSALRLAAERRGLRFNGRTPIGIGTVRYRQGLRYGNCGIMAAVAMFLANQEQNVAPSDMWLVSVSNPNTTKGWFKKSNLRFGHDYAELGTAGDPGGPFVVDPWAGVCCSLNDYPTVLKSKLDKWASQGKRVAVGWDDGQENVWTTANDDAILSLVAGNRTEKRIRGDQQG